MDITKDHVAIVTGGASGLGAATVAALRDAGARVVIFDMNAEMGEQHAKATGASFMGVDVSNVDEVAKSIEQVVADHGALHIAVNCAGIGPAAKTVSRGESHPPELFSKTIGVNLIGSFNVASIAAKHIALNDPVTADGGRGVIVNTASVAAYEGQVGQVAYAASKGGIVGMTLPMARDLSQLGIRVVSIAPGLFLTPLLESLPQEVQDSLGEQVPFPSRLGAPAEYAKMVRQIIDNDMLNGETIRLDGAIRMAPR
ncbi:MAG: SDR family NAD(P)-dependent oxidoreductase [Rhodobacteraceae bacterium]|jgi:NAD(P)-dependent dehydrogenase (short-subunit alcohol dehydrogenase family)|nr:SDR family NAD(P)-dependent oxidoreductase [Paracoccaceae bacterium]NDH20412.1 SDR family NAD(P)-dependent oxidoreductase [Paracoccaceae bacterium]